MEIHQPTTLDDDTSYVVGPASSTDHGVALYDGTTGKLLQNSFSFVQLANGNVGIGTTSPTNILSFGGNAARTVWMERHTTANTAGNNLTLQSGGATVAATDKAGGNLILAPGLSTGTGNNQIILQTSTPQGSTNTTDNALVTRATLDSKALQMAVPVRLKGYTVATLPAGTQGDTAFVTDALAPTFLATIVGGGAIVTPVFFDGTNWVGY